MKRLCFALGLLLLLSPELALAVNLPTLSLGVAEANTPAEVSTALQVLLLLTILTVAPAILLMTTAFTRIVIVLGFVRQAMGTQNTPPNQVLLGLALFLTFFIMAPTFNAINSQALQPYMQEKMTQQQALARSVDLMRDFMFSQVQESELQLLIDITKEAQPADKKEVSSVILIPAFMLSELKRAFQMGFMIYVP
ncbi:MAG: flagellar biosynthetic protein FliP, partial [Proteobacteria bacterium]|nr:flagellar biosynthetic protein FliP [Pseudomonadota bacterium]